MLSLISSVVYKPIHLHHSCHNALPNHISRHGDFPTSNMASSILIELCEKFSDSKLKTASTRLLPHLEEYHIKRNCKAGTWFSGKKTSPDPTTNAYGTGQSLILSDPFPLQHSEIVRLESLQVLYQFWHSSLCDHQVEIYKTTVFVDQKQLNISSFIWF